MKTVKQHTIVSIDKSIIMNILELFCFTSLHILGFKLSVPLFDLVEKTFDSVKCFCFVVCFIKIFRRWMLKDFTIYPKVKVDSE